MANKPNVVERAIAGTAVAVARLGLIDEERGRRTADLAWPRVVTGLARQSQRVADFAMVGVVLGPAAIAGIGFAIPFWSLATGIAFSLGNGSMTLISQRFGADDDAGLQLAVKQTIWVELAMAVGFVAAYLAATEPLIALLGGDPEAVAFGAEYLQVLSLALVFEFLNKVGSRTLVSSDDAWSPMVVRATGAVANIALNAIFIFGLGMGVAGAALGTVLATVGVTTTFAVGLYRGRLPYLGDLPVTIGTGGPYVDLGLMKQLLEISIPLMVRRLAGRGARFPMLLIVAQFGTVVVAAYVVSRRVRELMNTPGWGFGTATRSLVGQELGADDETEAEAYGWDILRFAGVVYGLMGVLTILFAPLIAPLFATDPETVATTVPFIMAVGVSLFGRAFDSPLAGALSAGGDTRWPLYGRLVGFYVFMLPLAYLGTVTPLGIAGLYLALVAETFVPGLVSFYRFRSGAWKAVSRKYRPEPTD